MAEDQRKYRSQSRPIATGTSNDKGSVVRSSDVLKLLFTSKHCLSISAYPSRNQYRLWPSEFLTNGVGAGNIGVYCGCPFIPSPS